MSIETILSFILVAVVWVSILLLSLVVWFFFPNGIYYWDKVYQNCSPTSAKYQYIVRFIYGDIQPTFQTSKSTITMDVLNKEHKSLVLIQLQPKQMENSVVYNSVNNLKVCRLLLYRTDPLVGITSIVVNHNGNGFIKVSTAEIQDYTSKEANIAYIGNQINALDAKKASVTQKFPAATTEVRPIEAELKPSLSLSAIEFFVLFFVAINLMLFMTLQLIPCKEEIICSDYREGLLSSIFAGLAASIVAAIVFTIEAFLLRNIIKKLLFANQGKGVFVYIRYVFLAFMVLEGVGLGIESALKGANHSKFPETNPKRTLFHEIFWMFGFGIALGLFFLLLLPIMSVIGYLIGFFSEPEEIRVDPAMPADLPKAGSGTTRSNDEGEGAEGGKDYYSKLIKGNTRVKSISQYKGVGSQSASKAPDKGPEQSNKVAPTASKAGTASSKATEKKSDDKSKGAAKGGKGGGVKKTGSTDSIGEGYYKQLMKGQGKVKSVSQY